MINDKLNSAVEYARGFLPKGRLVNDIPELARQDPKKLGVYIKTTDCRNFYAGDWQQEFTLQSVSKTMALIMALQLLGKENVFANVGCEASGEAFNALAKLETGNKTPANPFINAGAIAVASMLASNADFESFVTLVKKLCQDENIQVSNAVYLSEKDNGIKNRSIAYLMQSNGTLHSEAETALDFYFKMCSVNVSVASLANFAVLLANDGVNPQNNERIVESWIIRIVKTLMITCGMYDESGEFAMCVGMPAKSGVSGCIIAVVEKKMGIVTYSPAINDKGTSIGGYKILEYLSNSMSLHCFSSEASDED